MRPEDDPPTTPGNKSRTMLFVVLAAILATAGVGVYAMINRPATYAYP